MDQIMQASELSEIAEQGRIQFEKDVLESSEFKSLIKNIEDAALKGYTGFYQKLDSSHDRRAYSVFIKFLIAAGYSAEIKRVERKSLFGVFYSDEFQVSWKKEEQE